MSGDKLTSLKLTEEQAKNLRELLDTYRSAKLISRLFRCLFVMVTLFVIDFNRLLDGIRNMKSYVVTFF